MHNSNILLFIFVLSFGCQAENTKLKSPFFVTISDGNPVQFWVNGVETYNEKEIGGMFSKCFCQPFECGDEIRTQFKDNTRSLYSLSIADEDHGILDTFSFTQVTSGVWENTLSNLDSYCDRELILSIIDPNGGTTIVPPTSMTDEGHGTTNWVKSPTQLSKAATGSPQTVGAYQILNLPSGTTITFSITITVTGTFTVGAMAVTLVIYDGDKYAGGTPIVSYSTGTDTTNFPTGDITPGSHVVTITLTPNTNSQRMYIDSNMQSTPSSASLTITIPSNRILYVPTASILAKSDCLNVADVQDETVLINYSNHRNYAGLNYSDISPDPDFNLRVPAVFFEPSFPQEQEVIELSDSKLLQLNSEIKQKRLLQIKQAPTYFHKKLIIALTHQFVYIDGQYWVKNDSYDIVNGNKKYPLRQAICYLTERDTIDRNVL